MAYCGIPEVKVAAQEELATAIGTQSPVWGGDLESSPLTPADPPEEAFPPTAVANSKV